MVHFTNKRLKKLSGISLEDKNDSTDTTGMPEHVTLYHGTLPESAKNLLKHGWSPDSGNPGSHQGQSRYLYLTSFPENAEWYAGEKGSSTILTVRVDKSNLIVDPEDGIGRNVDEEWENMEKYNLPANFALKSPISAYKFSIYRQ